MASRDERRAELISALQAARQHIQAASGKVAVARRLYAELSMQGEPVYVATARLRDRLTDGFDDLQTWIKEVSNA